MANAEVFLPFYNRFIIIWDLGGMVLITNRATARHHSDVTTGDELGININPFFYFTKHSRLVYTPI